MQKVWREVLSKMKIDKVTLKNEQAWVTFVSKDGEYMGTLHLVSDKFLEEVKVAISSINEKGGKDNG